MVRRCSPITLTHSETELPCEYSLIRVSREAMATRFEIALPYGTPNALEIAEAALDVIDELEDQLTVFRKHSEVSRLNRQAFEAPVSLESRLFELLQHAAGLTRDTQGAFDIAIGTLIKAWGFYRREGRVPPPRDKANALQASGMRHVILDSKQIRFLRRGLEINLGSIGKGYALDRAALLLKEQFGIKSAMLQAGGSSMLAIGCPPGNLLGWRVAIRHPHQSDRPLGTVCIADRALATTAATYQSFEYNGRRYGHVLDPRTGEPVEGVASASALAPDATTADALSTAFFVMGYEATRNWLASRGAIGAVMLPASTSVKTIGVEFLPPSLTETLSGLLSSGDYS